MRVILGGIAIALLVAVSAGAVLFSAQKPIYEAVHMPSVRLGNDAGDNLVGADWSGLYKTSPDQSRETQGTSIVVGED
jgi:hypothetical protein